MAWCRQATSHYMRQCWLSSLSPYGIARPQWVNARSSEVSEAMKFVAKIFISRWILTATSAALLSNLVNSKPMSPSLKTELQINGLMQDCSISIANTPYMLQFCTKPAKCDVHSVVMSPVRDCPRELVFIKKACVTTASGQPKMNITSTVVSMAV